MVVEHPRDVIKKEDSIMAYYFTARIANLLVRFTHRYLPFITPNYFTVTSMVLALVAAYFFAQGDYNSVLWGLLFWHISFVFDCCDGHLARMTGLKIIKGMWFDYHSDKIKDGVILLAIAWGAYSQAGSMYDFVGYSADSAIILVIAFLAIFFHFLRKINALNRDVITLETRGTKDKARNVFNKDNKGQLLRTLKHTALFKIADRILLFTLFGLLDMMVEALIIYALAAFFYSTVSGLLNYKVFDQLDKELGNKQ